MAAIDKPGGSAAWRFQSALHECVWPAVPADYQAGMLALLFQMEQAQWLSAEAIAERQFQQLAVVLRHAHASVPYYGQLWRGRYDPQAPLAAGRFADLPILSRRDLQTNFAALQSTAVPASHGAISESESTGSTGTPVRIRKTELAHMMWKVITLRDHLWHRRNLGGKLAAIRYGTETGEFEDWGIATRGLVATGPSARIGLRGDTDEQLHWIAEQRPDYLMTYPSVLAALVRRALERGLSFSTLKELRTLGEALSPELRDLCRQAWSVPVTDMYSADEVGYIALQCPAHDHLHVQSESLLVEVLDDAGRPCAAGQVGRVVVTDLHNMAMPLVRYEIGDYAVPGEPCSCGRGLPVLKRVIGRVRNMLVTAGGQRYWPTFGTSAFTAIAAIRQMQLAQVAIDCVEARLVTEAPLSPEQEARLHELILSRVPPGFRVTFSYRDHIARGAGGKYEDFICEIAPAGPGGRAA
ncbi:MAG: phenylacetate--CoA ligase family protein [Betaproteobacteria bacterium]|nr:phenylacetate--CoA ligase family protein [Betaproteobacteria bacterium]